MLFYFTNKQVVAQISGTSVIRSSNILQPQKIEFQKTTEFVSFAKLINISNIISSHIVSKIKIKKTKR